MCERVGEAAVAEERGGSERAGGREERQPRGAGTGERGEEGRERGRMAGAGGRRERRQVRVEGFRGGGGRSGGVRMGEIGRASCRERVCLYV